MATKFGLCTEIQSPTGTSLIFPLYFLVEYLSYVRMVFRVELVTGLVLTCLLDLVIGYSKTKISFACW